MTDVIGNPILPRSEDHPCPKYKHRETVFFRAESRCADEDMRLYYVCTNVLTELENKLQSLGELQINMKNRIEVSTVLRELRLSNIKNSYHS